MVNKNNLSLMTIMLSAFFLTACEEEGSKTLSDTSTTQVTFTTGQAADMVVGQLDFVTGDAARTDSGLNQPYTNSFVDSNGSLYIPDYFNNRILVYSSLPTQAGAVASMVVAQPDFTTAVNIGPSENHMNGPITPFVYGEQFFAVDYANHRLAIYNTIPTTSPGTMDVVIGQVDKISNGTSCSATTLYNPEAVFVVDGKIIIADGKNHRVLIWNSIPTSDGQAASLVLGQDTADTCTANTGGLGPNSLNFPTAIWSDGTKLVVSDSSNHRVLIWNSFPSLNAQDADIVLGQTSMYTNTSNQGGSASATSLNNPYEGLHSLNGQLAVADTNNHRVLIWQNFPTTNAQAADVVIGQVDFVSSNAATSAEGLNFPAGVFLHQNKLIVTDRANNRLVIYSGNEN
ncbi:MAG: hypothetical protein OEZ58_01365 [Gammaproteobacteria bacterium]|nr:hypothetical protein [Gammaproteobacteria bacterium]